MDTVPQAGWRVLRAKWDKEDTTERVAMWEGLSSSVQLSYAKVHGEPVLVRLGHHLIQ